MNLTINIHGMLDFFFMRDEKPKFVIKYKNLR